jgi:hypothetical protein
MHISCNRSYSDGKPDMVQDVVFGWMNKKFLSESGNFAYSDTPTQDSSSGYGEFYSIKWPWKTATMTEVKTNDGGGLIDERYRPKGMTYANTNSGIIYYTLTDRGSGNYSAELFKDSARTQQVAHTANYSTTGHKDVIEDNSSGLFGRIYISALGSDADIYITYSMTPNFTSGSQYAKKWSVDMREDKNMQPWILCIGAATNASSCSLSWDENTIPLAATDGLFLVEVDPLGFSPLPGATAVDMSVDSSVTVTPGSSPRYFRVYHGTAETTESITLDNGWNFISFSVFPSVSWGDFAVKRTSPINQIISFDTENSDYINDTGEGTNEIAPRTGFEVYSSGAQTITVTGIPAATKTTHRLLYGWNLVGLASDITPPIKDPKINGVWWTYSGGTWAAENTTIQKNVGYWVNVKDTLDININP